MTVTLWWLRRDFRLEDNKTLSKAMASGKKIQPIFIFDPNILKRFKNPRDMRLSFIRDALLELEHTGIWIFYGDPKEIIPKLCSQYEIKQIHAGEDFEPSSIKRDAEINRITNGKLELVLDHILIHPRKFEKPYKIFTPFAKKWLELKELEQLEPEIQEPLFAYLPAPDNHVPLIEILEKMGYKYNPSQQFIPKKTKEVLDNFLAGKITNYAKNRDFMDIDGTSTISPYLRFGLISIRECIRRSTDNKWLNELIWREFYASILYHFPEIDEMEFQPQYRNMPWIENDDHWHKFINAKTGYQIVDAAITQLLTTGWMHNRARMIVASFLTKHLLMDWRKGEEFFAQYLMDYDRASNIGGWQWAASVGTDAQPYFRIFNPILQAQKFDPKGQYVYKYLPEYVFLQPIIEHNFARKRAIEFFKK